MTEEMPARKRQTCIFCPNPADSQEDIFPQWLDKTWRLPPGVQHGKMRLLIGGRDVGQAQRIAAKKTRSKCVCQPCNNGWMSRLETSVRPTLGAIINGYERSMAPAEQSAIARWASLKAACFDATPHFSDPSASQTARDTIRGTHDEFDPGRSPDRWAVWLGTYPRLNFSTHELYESGTGADGNPLTTFNFTIAMGFVVLLVQARTGGVELPPIERMPGGYDLSGGLNPELPPIVTLNPPRLRAIDWPLKSSLTPEKLTDVLTFQQSPNIRTEPNVRRDINTILQHKANADCRTCEDMHEKNPEIPLPVTEPARWLP